MVRLDDNPRKVKYTGITTIIAPRVYMTAMLIGCTNKTVARFDHQRGNLSRSEYLNELLDLAEGIGEVV